MPSFDSFDRVWFLTWTTYGTWLPGDDRGFVSPKFDGEVAEKRNNEIGVPYDAGRTELQRLAQAKLKGEPVYLNTRHANALLKQLNETAQHRGWTIVAAAIMTNHVHLLVGVIGDPSPATMMRDFKAYGRRALSVHFCKPESGTWWTEQGSKRKIKDATHYNNVFAYIRDQQNPLIIFPK